MYVVDGVIDTAVLSINVPTVARASIASHSTLAIHLQSQRIHIMLDSQHPTGIYAGYVPHCSGRVLSI